MKKLLFKLHPSLPTAIMALFDWTASKLLLHTLLIPKLIKYFFPVFLPPFLGFVVHDIFYSLFAGFKLLYSKSLSI